MKRGGYGLMEKGKVINSKQKYIFILELSGKKTQQQYGDIKGFKI